MDWRRVLARGARRALSNREHSPHVAGRRYRSHLQPLRVAGLCANKPGNPHDYPLAAERPRVVAAMFLADARRYRGWNFRILTLGCFS